MEEFEKDLNEIKSKLDEFQLSEEFKLKLQEKMDEKFNELDDNQINIKTKVRKFPSSLVAAFACFFFLISGYVTFADEFEDWVTKIFSNTDKKIEIAAQNGNYREIDMDYVESNGIGIKVDYVIAEDDMLCIAFNVKTEEEYDDMLFQKIEILNSNDEKIFGNLHNQNVYDVKYKSKKINEKELIIVYEYKMVDANMNDFLREIASIKIINIGNERKDREIILIEGIWEIKL